MVSPEGFVTCGTHGTIELAASELHDLWAFFSKSGWQASSALSIQQITTADLQYLVREWRVPLGNGASQDNGPDQLGQQLDGPLAR